jgi:hypothetical protein
LMIIDICGVCCVKGDGSGDSNDMPDGPENYQPSGT